MAGRGAEPRARSPCAVRLGAAPSFGSRKQRRRTERSGVPGAGCPRDALPGTPSCLQRQHFSAFFLLICGPQSVCLGGVSSLRNSAWGLFAASACSERAPEVDLCPILAPPQPTNC